MATSQCGRAARLVATVGLVSVLLVVRRTWRPPCDRWPQGTHPLDRQPQSGRQLLEALYQYLERPQPCCRHMAPFGGRADGDGDKLVCLDGAVAPPAGRCLVYSVGISADWSFDRAMAARGCEVHCFDPSVARADGSRTEFGAMFHRVGLSAENRTDADGHRFATLSQLKAALGHGQRTIDYLKVDVEGAEWGWLDGEPAAVFSSVRQLAMEVHFFGLAVGLPGYEHVQWYFDIFQFLREQGFQLVSCRENSVSPGRTQVEPFSEEKATLFELLFVNVNQ